MTLALSAVTAATRVHLHLCVHSALRQRLWRTHKLVNGSINGSHNGSSSRSVSPCFRALPQSDGLVNGSLSRPTLVVPRRVLLIPALRHCTSHPPSVPTPARAGRVFSELTPEAGASSEEPSLNPALKSLVEPSAVETAAAKGVTVRKRRARTPKPASGADGASDDVVRFSNDAEVPRGSDSVIPRGSESVKALDSFVSQENPKRVSGGRGRRVSSNETANSEDSGAGKAAAAGSVRGARGRPRKQAEGEKPEAEKTPLALEVAATGRGGGGGDSKAGAGLGLGLGSRVARDEVKGTPAVIPAATPAVGEAQKKTSGGKWSADELLLSRGLSTQAVAASPAVATAEGFSSAGVPGVRPSYSKRVSLYAERTVRERREGQAGGMRGATAGGGARGRQGADVAAGGGRAEKAEAAGLQGSRKGRKGKERDRGGGEKGGGRGGGGGVGEGAAGGAGGEKLAQNRTAYVQVLGTGMDTGDTSPCVLLFFERLRLVFNAGEGLQRLCIEHKIRLAKIDKIFLSRVCTETAGGLPGMLLTLANTGETGITVDICGPSDLHRLAAAMRCFVGAASVRTSSFGTTSPGRPSYPHPPLPPSYHEVKQQLLLGQQEQGGEGGAAGQQQQQESGQGREDKSAFIVHHDGDVKVTAVLLEPSRSPSAEKPLVVGDSSATLPSPSESLRELTLSQHASASFKEQDWQQAKSAKRPSPGSSGVSSGWEVAGGSDKRARTAAGRLGQQGATGAMGWETGDVALGAASGAALETASETASGIASVVYVCELPTAAGKFDPKRAAAMGIRPGPKYRRLQMGESVPSDDGSKTVHPSDVLGASIPGPVVLLIDCPTASHTQALLQSPQLQRFCSSRHNRESGSGGGGNTEGDNNEGGTKEVTVAVHVSPEAVVEADEYRRWMGMLGPNTTHVLAGHGRAFECPPVLAGSAALTAKLHYVCPHLFPEPYDHTLAKEQNNNEQKDDSGRPAVLGEREDDSARGYALEPVDGLPMGPVVIAKNLLKFNLRGAPILGADASAVPPVFNAQNTVHHLLRSIPELKEASRKVAADWGLKGPEQEGEKKEEAEGEGERSGEDQMGIGGGGGGEGASKVQGLEKGRSEERRRKKDTVGAEVTGTGTLTGSAYKEDESSCVSEEAPAYMRGMGREEVEVVFLGTGSSQPSKYRNLSGIYLHRFDYGGMILDCGEGSYAQLTRRFGPEKAEDIIAGLKCIWISHIHADHHTGLVRILAARRDILLRRAAQRAAERAGSGAGTQALPEKMVSEEQDKDATVPVPPVLVIGPKQLRRYLEAYQTFESLHLTFLDCSQTTRDAAALAAKAAAGGGGGGGGREEAGGAGGARRQSGGAPREEDGGMEESDDGRDQCGLIWQKATQSQQQQQQQQQQRRPEPAGEGGERDRKGLRPFWLKTGFHLEDGGLDEPGRRQLGEVLSALGLSRLESVPVVHCPQAFAVVLEGRVRGGLGSVDRGSGEEDSWKLVYSGDTRPCDTVRVASRGATVLIHERGATAPQVEAVEERATAAQVEAVEERATAAQVEAVEERATAAQVEAVEERATAAQVEAVEERATAAQVEAVEERATAAQIEGMVYSSIEERATGIFLLVSPFKSTQKPQATFEDDLQHEAIARRHSTTSEAVQVGASAPAYRTILTHFSQRYPKIPRLAPPVKNKKRGGGRGNGSADGGDVEDGESGSAAIAFDLMSVNFCDLPKLPELVPVFQLLFRDALEEEEEEQEGEEARV
ncbi:hypothetical protein CLOP_g19109 [Closterium sp. NIES-67]|nr:hypothetical protein CLOP_g19109 [Closterium sp. NIES-67]GJP62001.1 hypothetical protein CLOP_g19109 [Closterium sp. NIES-67]